MISSGESMLDVAKELKRRKARKVFVCATFGLFTNGLQKFDEYYENGVIDRVLTTNLIYQSADLLSRPYYIDVDMSKYIALIIDNLNHDASLSELLNQREGSTAWWRSIRRESGTRAGKPEGKTAGRRKWNRR